MTEMLLRTEHISKAFIGVQALDDVNVDIRKESIHCLVGENGSGKSTFVKTISGIYEPDRGRIILNGKEYGRLTPPQAIDEGVQVIYQDLSLFPHMTVAENIAINRLRQSGKKIINWKEIYRIAQEQIDKIGVSMDLNASILETSMANRQLTAICRALSLDAKLLFMDEPTSALTRQEVKRLLKIVHELKEQGLSVVFISHKLDEVFEVADEITIFRDGKKIGDFKSDELTEGKLAYYMTGREVTYPRYKRSLADDSPLLEVRGLEKKGNYKDISFSVRKGDILGIIGLLGSGRTELALSLFGLNPPDAGEILFEGKPVKINSPSAAKQTGIALLPEDRGTQGLFRERCIRENVSAAMLGEISTKTGVLNREKEALLAEEGVQKLRVRTPSAETVVGSLSGGNQQKCVVAKWISTDPKLFIMDSPTVGIDIGSKAEIYELIQSFAAKGMAIILITDEMEELLANANRVLVFSEGRIAAELNEDDLNRENIGQAISALISGADPGKGEQGDQT